MSKHTPGPWGCTYTSNHAHDYRLTKANGHSLPVNEEGNDHSEQRANARLIARAPEMAAEIERLTARVKELEEALERIDRIEVYDEDARETLRAKLGVMRDIARAARKGK